MKKVLFCENKNIISENLKVYRTKNKMSQSTLAGKMQVIGINIDQQMISKIENNTRMVTDYELAGFCAVLGISPIDMLSNFNVE